MTEAAMTRDFAMTGMPRSGTTYLCAVLHNPPNVITISEAKGEWKQLFQEHGASQHTLQPFSDYRERILRGEPVSTLEGTAGYRGEGPVDTWNQERETRRLDANLRFVLGMKNPAVFLELLGVFKTMGLRCVITVRHPVAVLSSWVRGVRRQLERQASIEGTFANGDSVAYRSSMKNAVDRRIDLHNYFAKRILDHKDDWNVLIVRHEDWFTDSTQLARIGRFLGIEHKDVLQPAPRLTSPSELPALEQEQILSDCFVASDLGYPTDGRGRLQPLRMQPIP
jgi:hypothetical protein